MNMRTNTLGSTGFQPVNDTDKDVCATKTSMRVPAILVFRVHWRTSAVAILALLMFPLSIRSAGVKIQDGTTLELQDGTTLSLPDASTLEVENLGTFKSNTATVTRSEATSYEFEVKSGGTIDAQSTVFEYMGTGGINIESGATITSLDGSTFRNGQAGPLLQINSAATQTFSNIIFTGPAKAATHNVKTAQDVSTGRYTFACAACNYAGDQWDWDPGDAGGTPSADPHTHGTIRWSDPFATELISFEAQAGWEEVLVQWISEAEIQTEKYILERSLSEDSGFEPIKEVLAQGESVYSYTDKKVVPGVDYWYKLTAVSTNSDDIWGPVRAIPRKCEITPIDISPGGASLVERDELARVDFTVPGKHPSESKVHVSLTVCDVSGRVIATLANREYSPGSYSVSWEPENCSGVHFYHLQVGDQSVSKKFVVY